MLGILLLSFAGAIVFVGFGLPFVVSDHAGLWLGFGFIAVGSVLLRVIESKTGRFLGEDTEWNRLMKADGENLIERDNLD